jgi:hypothetical protein
VEIEGVALDPDMATAEKEEREAAAQAAAKAEAKVRKAPWSRPRSRVNSGPLWLYFRRDARANVHLLGQPDTFLA